MTPFKHKFSHCFPIFSTVTGSPIPVFGLSLVLMVVGYFNSPYFPLAVLTTYLFLLAFRCDYPASQQMLLSPTVLFLAPMWLKFGVGIGFLAFATGSQIDHGLLFSQCGAVVFFLSALIGVSLSGVNRKPLHLPRENVAYDRDVLGPLAYFGVLCVLYACVATFLSLATGVADRGFAGGETDIAIGDAGAWGILSAMHRFRWVGFVLLPLIWQRREIPFRGVLVGLVGFSLFLSLLNGDRGKVLWTFAAIAFGYYFFTQRPRIRVEFVAIAAAPLMAVFLFLLNAYRTSDEFSESRALDLGARVTALKNVGDTLAQKRVERELKGWGQGFSEAVGSRLYGGFDNLVFAMTPGVYPHAWFQGFSAMPTVWLPYSVFGMRERAAAMADGYFIASMYRGSFGDGRTRYGITMNADLYRRFGWFGYPIAAVLIALSYGLYWKIILHIYYRKNALLGILLVLLMFSLFFGKSYTTVMGSWKLFAYDIPKHAILCLPYVWMMRKRTKPALAY